MHSVLYLHGFASSPNSQKVTSLRTLLEPDVVLNTPDLNVPSFVKLDFQAIVQHVLDAAAAQPPDAIAGSSLGAIVALEIARRGVLAPLVLIAPALGIADRWRSKLPPGDPIRVFNHALGTETDIHRAFFLQMSEVHVDEKPPAAPVTVIMGTNDESVPFASVQNTWRSWEAAGLAPGSHFITLEGADHGLTAHVDLIAREIARATETQGSRS